MPLTRRALILSATAASVVAPLASAAPSRSPAPPPNGLWRSRSTADLVVFDQRARRTYTCCYSSAVALVDESPLEEIERETLDAQLENDSRLELEYWGTVTRFQYDRINGWPTPLPLGNGNWVSDPGMTVDA